MQDAYNELNTLVKMNFIPISIKNYVKMHLENNPSESEIDLRNRLNSSLMVYQITEQGNCGAMK